MFPGMWQTWTYLFHSPEPSPQTTPFDQKLKCISRWSKERVWLPVSKARYGDALTLSYAWRGMGSSASLKLLRKLHFPW